MKNRWKWCALALSGLMLSGLISSVSAEEPLEDLQLKAYLSLVKGDAARDKTRSNEAIGHYKRALNYYERVKKVDSSFRPDIVEYRLRYCTSQMEDLQNRLIAPPSPTQKAEKAKTNALMQENTYLRKRIGQMEIANEKAVEEPDARPIPEAIFKASDDLENNVAQKKIENLSSQLAQTKEEKKTAAREAQALQSQLALLEQARKKTAAHQQKLSEEAQLQKQANKRLLKRAEDLEEALIEASNSTKTDESLELQLKSQDDLLTFLKKERSELKTQLEEALQAPRSLDTPISAGSNPLKKTLNRMKEMDLTITHLQQELREREATLEKMSKENDVQPNTAEINQLKKELAFTKKELLKNQSTQEKKVGLFSRRASKNDREKKQGEITSLKNQVHDLQKILRETEKTNRKLRNDVEKNQHYRKELSQAQASLKKLSGQKRTLTKLQKKIDSLHLENRAYNERISGLKSELKEQKMQRTAGHQERTLTLTDKISRLEAQVKDLNIQLLEAQKIERQDTPQPDINILSADQQISQANEAEIAALKANREKSRTAIRQVMSKLAEYKAYVERLKTSNEGKINALVQKIDDLNRQNEALQSVAE